jgi:tetratricopeptide (TPR) repeat protein
MKKLICILLMTFSLACDAQITPGKLSFALPEHDGRLSLDQSNLKITEMSAKSNNREFGIRAEDGSLHFLGFLFLWPEKPHLTAETCRDEMLKNDGPDALAAASGRSSMKSDSGADIAVVLLIPKSGKFSTTRAFVASGDMCADLAFTDARSLLEQGATMKQMQENIRTFLRTIDFDPQAKPAFRDTFAYATVEWKHEQIAGATLAYKAALKLVDRSDDPTKWRRVTTDRLSMALGMAGDLKQSRVVNEDAIERDPNYPIYYYDLACADAEEGNASAARIHLQQAFARKMNTLPGETMPDPTSDDSILKLKSNQEFWSFVETLR